MADAAQSEKPVTAGNPGSQDLEKKQAKQEQQHGQMNSHTEEKTEHDSAPKKDDKKEDKKPEEQPAGGYDSTPIPKLPPGWTIKITFHRATNLPMADINSFSSDPYVLAQINSSLPQRHKEDPEFRLRTPTIRRNTNPEWNTEWIIANVPSSGFKLKARVYDEDPADHDDRLGNVHVHVGQLSEGWAGIQNEPYSIMKRSGSKRAYLLRAFAVCFGKIKHMSGDLYISIELLGRTKDDNGGRMYTIGPCWYTRHYSPMLGRIANRKDPDAKDNNARSGSDTPSQKQKKAERYNFQANQMQLQGPVPAELYHRYVEFKPFVKGMFTHSGIRGFLLSKALHHQHARVYNFDRSTKWGHFPQGPCKEMTEQFLDLVHYDEGGRIYTYVLTLDSLFRFTETGKEFGIDMLSKHTMHSDVSIYIAFSGEFFIRRLKHPNQPPPPEPAEETSQSHPKGKGVGENPSHPPDDLDGGPPKDDAPKDPAYYELIIDNDSGTYRPNAKMLPLLKQFLAASLPGIHIQVLDCQADEEKMSKWKNEQRERKKTEGDNVVYAQGDRTGSISSSDEEELDAMEAGGSGHMGSGLGAQVMRDAGLRKDAHLEHLKGYNPMHQSSGNEPADDGEAAEDEGQPIGASGKEPVQA